MVRLQYLHVNLARQNSASVRVGWRASSGSRLSAPITAGPPQPFSSRLGLGLEFEATKLWHNQI